jgi:hypothetical protein
MHGTAGAVQVVERRGLEKLRRDLGLGQHGVSQRHGQALVARHAPDELEVARAAQ